MSVINQMLRDLEEREPQPLLTRAELAAIEGIAAPTPKTESPPRHLWKASLIALAALVAGAGAAWYALDRAGNRQAVASMPAPQETAVAATEAPVPTARSELVVTPVEAEPPTPADPLRLVDLRHAHGKDESTVALRIRGDGELAPILEMGTEQGEIILPEVAIDGVAVGQIDDPRIRRLAVNDDRGDLRIRYAAASGVSVKVATQRSTESGPVVTLAFAGPVNPPEPPAAVSRPKVQPSPEEARPAPKPDREPVAAPTVSKRAVPTSAADRADALFRQAALDLRAGRPYSAEAKLRGALREQPAHIEAARVLGSLLMADGRTDEAADLLGRALHLNSGSAALAHAYARLKLQTGAPEEAVAVLETALPVARQDPDYLALLATAYQRTGRYERSATMFDTAVRLRPETAKWWVGLGIALEAGGRADEALTAFRRSVELGGLDAKLADYAQARINALASKG